MKTCSKCSIEKEENEFYFFKKRNYINSYCKSCSSAINRAAKSKFFQENGFGHTTAWRRKNPNNILKANAWNRNRNQEIKLQLIAGYGGKCTCCGETNPVFLTLEHKNHDGQEHRKALGGSKHRGGLKVYKDVINRGFPPEYTVLCMNCNFAEKDKKLCPHKKERSREVETYRYFIPNMN